MRSDITIQTDELARSIDVVSKHVQGTTAAVGVMQTAVIAEEKMAADRITNNLNLGFFNLVTSQITQQVVDHVSNTEAISIELLQQKKVLQNIQNRMEVDYNRISSRYGKIFRSLNQALKNRIYELDRPTFELASQKYKHMQIRVNNLASSVPIGQLESVTESQVIAAAHVKRNAQRTIESIKDFILKSHFVDDLTQKVTINEKTAQVETYYVPMVVKHEVNDIVSIYKVVPNEALKKVSDNSSYDNIEQTVQVNADQAAWHNIDKAQYEKILSNFKSMVSDNNLSKRVKDKMLQLIDRNGEWKSL